jgi:hypothetical protein
MRLLSMNGRSDLIIKVIYVHEISCHQKHQRFIPEWFRSKDFINVVYVHLVSSNKALACTLIKKL